MLFYNFKFLSHELLLGVSIAIERENSDHAQESEYLHYLSLLEVLQAPVPVVILFDISNHAYARYVAYDGPAEGRPNFVSFYLHELQVTCIIEGMELNLRLVFEFIGLLQVVHLFVPRALVL